MRYLYVTVAGLVLTAGPVALPAAAQTETALTGTRPPTEGPAVDGSPAWFLQGSFPDPGGRTIVDGNGQVTTVPRSEAGDYSTTTGDTPGCRQSPICSRGGGRTRQSLRRVQWEQTLGYTFTYPYSLPPGFGGVSAVALDSKDHLWVLQRAPAGKPQLFKFDPDYNLVLEVGPDVIGYQDKAHGMAVDPEDNVWITATNGATVMKLSPEGKLLLTLGESGRRGDWDEARGQRLLWQPVMVAFGPNSDVYIAQGHGNESPNDTDSDDPANNIGASRILHVDSDGNYINQWFGNDVGPGKFNSAHGLAVDPTNGDVWIGDREDYRIVIYTAEGEFLRTLQMRNLPCALYFDSHGQPWMASGQDGQFLKLDRTGRVLGAVGNGMGVGTGQFTEASYWVMDRHDNLYAGDTSVGRITRMVAPGQQ